MGRGVVVKKLVLVAFSVLIIVISISGGYYYNMLNSSSPTNLEASEKPIEPAPKESLPEFEYEVEVELDSTNGFVFSKREDINRNAGKIMVLFPGESGTIPITIFSTGSLDYNLSLTLDISGMEDEFNGAEYSLTPASLYLQAGGTANALFLIESTEDAPTGYYNVRIKANNGEGSKGATLPPLIIAPIIPEFIFFFDPTAMITPPEGEIPCFEIDSGKELSVMIHYAEPIEPLTLNVSSSPIIDFEILNDVIEIVPIHPRHEPEQFYQVKLKPTPEIPVGSYTITITGTTESYSFERSLILNMK